ncbi:hypothetical protein B0T19DRAFT_416807 [Cercophora scortea]|uniref:Uncharacterized protein n=1 Tax=Cercophora scortea TaxID=314031 RepID=A0AAE0IXM4_9PEZI|nr:hypothetical protein B0T19DRAFT_416807 [Cercophora scortea]
MCWEWTLRLSKFALRYPLFSLPPAVLVAVANEVMLTTTLPATCAMTAVPAIVLGPSNPMCSGYQVGRYVLGYEEGVERHQTVPTATPTSSAGSGACRT